MFSLPVNDIDMKTSDHGYNMTYEDQKHWGCSLSFNINFIELALAIALSL